MSFAKLEQSNLQNKMSEINIPPKPKLSKQLIMIAIILVIVAIVVAILAKVVVGFIIFLIGVITGVSSQFFKENPLD